MPVDRINNSTFPSYDASIANAAPLPGTRRNFSPMESALGWSKGAE